MTVGVFDSVHGQRYTWREPRVARVAAVGSPLGPDSWELQLDELASWRVKVNRSCAEDGSIHGGSLMRERSIIERVKASRLRHRGRRLGSLRGR